MASPLEVGGEVKEMRAVQKASLQIKGGSEPLLASAYTAEGLALTPETSSMCEAGLQAFPSLGTCGECTGEMMVHRKREKTHTFLGS